MATKGEDVKADIRKLGGTLAAHKGWFTREYRTLSRQLDELLVPGRPSSEETLAIAKSRYEKLRVHADNVDAVIGQMCELTPEDSDHHLGRVSDVADMLSTIERGYTRLLDEAEARKQAPARCGRRGGYPQLLQVRQPSEVFPEARLNSDVAYVRLLVSGPSVSLTTPGTSSSGIGFYSSGNTTMVVTWKTATSASNTGISTRA
jgi:hypothetical protein